MRPAILAVDIGNTNIVIGVYGKEEWVAHWRVATDTHKTADEYAVLLERFFAQNGLQFSDMEGGIISCVVPPLLPTFEEMCRKYMGIIPLVVGPRIKTGVRICTDNPHEVGADRVVNALAAYRLYGAPAIVIDFGTATTFDVVSKDGSYLGGAIAPGVTIAAEALFQRTAKLPRIELIAPKGAIGRNTVHSMQSGVIYGYVGLVEGLVKRIQDELGEKARVIATGGLANTITKETSVIKVVNVNLTLEGLRLIYEMNEGKDGSPEG